MSWKSVAGARRLPLHGHPLAAAAAAALHIPRSSMLLAPRVHPSLLIPAPLMRPWFQRKDRWLLPALGLVRGRSITLGHAVHIICRNGVGVNGVGLGSMWEPCDCNLRETHPTRAGHLDPGGFRVRGACGAQPGGPPGKSQGAVGSEPTALAVGGPPGLGLLALQLLLLQLGEADEAREQQLRGCLLQGLAACFSHAIARRCVLSCCMMRCWLQGSLTMCMSSTSHRSQQPVFLQC